MDGAGGGGGGHLWLLEDIVSLSQDFDAAYIRWLSIIAAITSNHTCIYMGRMHVHSYLISEVTASEVLAGRGAGASYASAGNSS